MAEPDDQFSVENMDWIKTGTWDIHNVRDGMWSLVETPDDLLEFLGVIDATPEEQKAAIEKQMALPSWVPAPQPLKDGITAHLATLG